MQEAQKKEERTKKAPRCSSPTRLGDTIRVSATDGQFYVKILNEMKAKVNPMGAGLEALTIRRTRKEEILLVLRSGRGTLTRP